MAGIEDLSPELQQQLRLGAIMLKDPAIAREAKRLAKKADPSLRIPEIELEDQVNAVAVKNNERIDALEQQLVTERVNARHAAFRADCEKQGLDPDEVEKIVVAEKCSTATALKMAVMQRETAAPSAPDVRTGNPQGAQIDMRPEADVRKLYGGALRRWSADTAAEMIDGFRKVRRAVAR